MTLDYPTYREGLRALHRQLQTKLSHLVLICRRLKAGPVHIQTGDKAAEKQLNLYAHRYHQPRGQLSHKRLDIFWIRLFLGQL